MSACGCSESGAGKAWSALSVCALGKAADAPAVERLQQLRLLQLSYVGEETKPDGWPARCATYANQLYAAIESSGKQASLKRSMQSKLGCSESKPSCVLNNETLPLLVGELADGAKAAELKFEPVPAVKSPEASVKLILSTADWQPMQQQSAQLVGPELTASGRVQWLLKAPSGRTRPTGCVFTPGGQKLECIAGNEKMPAFPPQSIQLVTDDKDLYVAGLTEEGQAAYSLRTGESVTAKGIAGNLVQDGLAIEQGDGDKGFRAIAIAKHKAAKPIELKTKSPIVQPHSIGSQIFWLEAGEGKRTFVAKTLKGNRLADSGNVTGIFEGPFHICRRGPFVAVGTWSGHTGQRSAKPTSGSDMTAATVTLWSDGAWAKPAEVKLPFRRVIESDFACSNSGASMAWLEPTDGGFKVGRLDCDQTGCKTTEGKLPGVESRWLWSVGPVGDKVLVLWRANLGEARMRLAPIAELERTKDIVLFDDQDHGGPKAGEATSVFTPEGALLLFKQEPPVLLGIAADASIKVLTAAK